MGNAAHFSYSLVQCQFFKNTISNTAQNKGTSPHAAWSPKHTRLPLKCSVQPERQHYKNALTRNVPHSRTQGRAPLKAGFPPGFIRSADLVHSHPPRFHICNYHWKSHTPGTALELRPNFPMIGQELIESPNSCMPEMLINTTVLLTRWERAPGAVMIAASLCTLPSGRWYSCRDLLPNSDLH